MEGCKGDRQATASLSKSHSTRIASLKFISRRPRTIQSSKALPLSKWLDSKDTWWSLWMTSKSLASTSMIMKIQSCNQGLRRRAETSFLTTMNSCLYRRISLSSISVCRAIHRRQVFSTTITSTARSVSSKISAFTDPKRLYIDGTRSDSLEQIVW